MSEHSPELPPYAYMAYSYNKGGMPVRYYTENQILDFYAKEASKFEEELLALHRKLAAETLRADQGWSRYEAANAARNRAEAELASLAGVLPADEGDKK